ncbi:hypothetical protein DSECCO2_653520 [anaerobic digester metagenome]
MPIDIQIQNESVNGFNAQAKIKLEESVNEFISDLIEEANRIESGRNTTSGSPEITSSMVNDARVLIRRGLAQPKKGLRIKILRIFSSVLSLAVGIMYDSTKLQNSGYMLFFIIVIAAAILSVTIATIKE